MRIGFVFEKIGAAKYISHLDLQRAFSRAIRRSGMPVKLSQGFNPHYVLSFASALALGIESEYECAETEITQDVSPDAFLQAVDAALPPGLHAKQAVRLADGSPKLMAAMREAEYQVLIKGVSYNELSGAICDIMDSKEIMAEKISKRGTKEVDIRNMIQSMEMNDNGLRMRLLAGSSGSLKPGIVMDELKKRVSDFTYRIIRTGLYTHADGKAVGLLESFKA